METMETVVKKPGLELWPLWHYEVVQGDLETNGKKQLGHYKTKDADDNEVVVVPDAPITRIEFNERSSVHRKKTIGKTDDDVDPGFMAKRQWAAANSMVPGFSGRHMRGSMVEELLTLPRSAAPSSTPAASSPATSMAAGHAAPSQQQANDSSSIPSDGRSGRRKSGGSSGSSVLVAAVGGRASSGSAGGGSTGTAAVAAGGAKAGRGRPKKDWCTEVDKLCLQFSQSAPIDPMWWGAEVKTS